MTYQPPSSQAATPPLSLPLTLPAPLYNLHCFVFLAVCRPLVGAALAVVAVALCVSLAVGLGEDDVFLDREGFKGGGGGGGASTVSSTDGGGGHGSGPK